MKKTVVVGTRGSKLALKQADIVIKKLQQIYPEHHFIIQIVKTTGDAVHRKPLHLIGGKGLFVKEIEEKLLTGEIDLAVHSVKDLPAQLMKGLLLGAVLSREDPRDAFVSLSYDNIATVRNGGRIGTGSLRRRAQVLLQNSGVHIVPLRGNVETRIKRLETQKLDGIILAFAGIKRLGLEHHVRQIVPVNVMIPACGQGAIGIEIRDEEWARRFVEPINHGQTLREIEIERTLLARIGGGCHMPLGIHSVIAGNTVKLHVSLGNGDGQMLLHNLYTGNVKNVEALISKVLSKLGQFDQKKSP